MQCFILLSKISCSIVEIWAVTTTYILLDTAVLDSIRAEVDYNISGNIRVTGLSIQLRWDHTGTTFLDRLRAIYHAFLAAWPTRHADKDLGLRPESPSPQLLRMLKMLRLAFLSILSLSNGFCAGAGRRK